MSEMTLDQWRRIAEGLDSRIAELEEALEDSGSKVSEAERELENTLETVNKLANLTNKAQRDAKNERERCAAIVDGWGFSMDPREFQEQHEALVKKLRESG